MTSLSNMASTPLESSKVTDQCNFCEEINRASEACPPDPNKPKVTKTGAVILGIAGGFFVAVYAATAPFLLPAMRKICLPFVPATTEQVKNIFTALKGRKGSLIDIGSGDGRIVSGALLYDKSRLRQCMHQSINGSVNGINLYVCIQYIRIPLLTTVLVPSA